MEDSGRQAFFWNENTGLVTMYAGKTLMTTDDGEAWNGIVTPFGGEHARYAMAGGQSGVIIQYRQIAYSTNGGRSFSSRKFPVPANVRRTVEIWYGLPNRASVSTPGHLAPRMCRSTNRRGSAPEPEIWFRIVHIALESRNDGPMAVYREQAVEIPLWLKGIFENGNTALAERSWDVIIKIPERGTSSGRAG